MKPIHVHNKGLIAKSLTACEMKSSSVNVMEWCHTAANECQYMT